MLFANLWLPEEDRTKPRVDSSSPCARAAPNERIRAHAPRQDGGIAHDRQQRPGRGLEQPSSPPLGNRKLTLPLVWRWPSPISAEDGEDGSRVYTAVS